MDAINVEVISVGPQFRELDYRGLECYTRRPCFSRYDPAPPTLFS
jgi:hypothetical protein